MPGWPPRPVPAGAKASSGLWPSRAQQAAKGDMGAVQPRQLTRDGSGAPPPHPGLLRAAHTHHGGGRGLTGTPPTRGAGPGSREVSGACGSGRVALVTGREPSAELGKPQVRAPAPHGALAGSRTVGEGLQDLSGVGEVPGPWVRGCRSPRVRGSGAVGARSGRPPRPAARGCRTILGQENHQARG